MDKITQVNIEGHNYGFVAGQAVRGVSGAQAADYVKTVILPEGASLVEGMLLAVTFVNGNAAGFSGSISVFSSDGETFYYDAQMTDPVTLPPDHCYSIEHVAGDEYVYLAYVCLSINNVLTPVSNASGYLSGGPLWESGDTVLFVYFSDFFMMTKQNSGPSDYSRQGAYCDTAGSVQAKVAEMVGYSIQNGQDFPITFTEANTYADKITLSINGTTACDVYIKGAVSSSSNYTLPAGTYIVHYENSKYYIETAWGVPFAREANVARSCSGNSASATNAINATTAGTATNATNASRLTGINISNIRIGSAQAKISLNQLMTYLITTKKYIPSSTECVRVMATPWDYAGNDILQIAIDGVNYEVQLAGAIIEFEGYASNYQTGRFRLSIWTPPTLSFTSTSGYTKFPSNSIAQYICNGSTYSPRWRGANLHFVQDSYPTILDFDGSNNWIKFGKSNTSYGILPSASGSAGSGHNYIGTSSWYWKYAYIDQIFCSQVLKIPVGGSHSTNGEIWVV